MLQLKCRENDWLIDIDGCYRHGTDGIVNWFIDISYKTP